MSSDWFWEGNVQDALARHLAAEGWTIVGTANTATRERGIDLLATRGSRELAVEVKGYPSTTYARGPQAGQRKPTQPTNQAKHWFAEALLSAIRTRATYPGHELALALPEFPRYRRLLADTAWAFERLRIGLYVVPETGNVELVVPHEPD